ncbi:phage-related protein [Paraburkholderia sp. BL8N3]|nr:phage tail protein [Paraburkholderia sp. BL8N3]TCK37971.1 phage-related protein [Paraburkholderia sp. BL8N3]
MSDPTTPGTGNEVYAPMEHPATPLPLGPTPSTSLLVDVADEMLPERVRASAPRASGEVFKWCVTSASYDVEPKVVKAQFGDGYAQRRPAGINTQAPVWSISMKNIDLQTAGDVVQFLSDRNGVDIFNWTPPRMTTTVNVICPSWSFSYGDMMQDGSLLYALSFKFEQVFL